MQTYPMYGGFLMDFLKFHIPVSPDCVAVRHTALPATGTPGPFRHVRRGHPGQKECRHPARRDRRNRSTLHIYVAALVFLLLAVPVSRTNASGFPADTLPEDTFRHFTALTDDPFQAGQELRDSLGIHAVLDYWEAVYRQWKEEGRIDPRIGFRYVELAVEIGDAGRYALASEIHEWGLRSRFDDLYRDEIQSEMLMLEPLIERRDFREWERLFNDRDSRLLVEMSEFWARNNMVPSSDRNERLIEHWQRIHFSREHFTNDTNTIYGADDRSLIYVRLGPPDRQRSGTLSYNTAELRNRLYDLVEAGVISIGQIYTLQMNIMQNYSPGRYDFWRYDRISDEGPVIYLFGRPGREGRYRLLDSVEDFISGSGYRSVVIGRRGTPSAFRAGYFLQMMLYNEVSTLDNYFGMRFMEYERRWNQAIFHSGANARMLGDLLSPKMAAHDMQMIRARAPQSQSIYERNLITYPLMHRQYRFLDDGTGPVTFVFMHPSPRLHQLTDMLDQEAGINVAGYLLRQGFHLYTDGERTDRHIDEHVSEIREIESATGAFYTSAVFPVADSDTRIQLFSELYLRPGSAFAEIMSRSLVGVSREWIASDVPIRDDGSLVISDLVLGSTGKQPVRIRSAEMGVLSGYEINVEDDLQVYFEVYNLKPADNGEHRYSITYKLIQEGRRWLFFRRRTPEVSLAWEASSLSPRDYQFFEVDLSHADSGNYTLEIIVTDNRTEDKYQRSLDLKLKD